MTCISYSKKRCRPLWLQCVFVRSCVCVFVWWGYVCVCAQVCVRARECVSFSSV